jgi:hypothetical protein
MATPSKIVPKRSVQAGKSPSSTDLENGEICINHADKKLYAKHPSTGAIQEIGSLSAHSHDELYSLDNSQHIELQGNGTLVVTAGSTSKTLTLPGASGTLATLNDITAGGGGVSTINDLDEMFNSSRANYYHEVNYTTGGDVSAIEVYATSAKATHLYSRAFTYNASGNITQVLTTDRQNSGVSLTKTISYNGSGDIATVTRSYSL